MLDETGAADDGVAEQITTALIIATASVIVCFFIWYPFAVERYSCGHIDAQLASKVWANWKQLALFR